jgi:cell fate regulator YaaT (PSP1 superfamily)
MKQWMSFFGIYFFLAVFCTDAFGGSKSVQILKDYVLEKNEMIITVSYKCIVACAEWDSYCPIESESHYPMVVLKNLARPLRSLDTLIKESSSDIKKSSSERFQSSLKKLSQKELIKVAYAALKFQLKQSDTITVLQLAVWEKLVLNRSADKELVAILKSRNCNEPGLLTADVMQDLCMC